MSIRIGSWALFAVAVALVVSAVSPLSARAIESADGRFDCTRQADNSIAIDTYSAEESSLAIPASIELEDGSVGPVTAIEWYAFENCASVSTLTIPSTVTRVGQGAFMGCSALREIVIPVSVASVGSWAFERCSALTSATIGGGVTKIEPSTFSGCTSLRSVVLGSRIKSIGSDAFGRCAGLKTLVLPNSVATIGSAAFEASTKVVLTPRAALTKALAGKRRATLYWRRAVSGMISGYQVACKRAGARCRTLTSKSPKKTSRVVPGLSSGRKYAFQVRPYRTISGKRYYGTWSSAKVAKIR